jgi:hypothetical protein
MMPRSRRGFLLAGVGLILAANAVALGGAAWNRSGDPESTLRLSERELRVVGEPVLDRENSGMALRLRWRTLPRRAGPEDEFHGLGYAYGGPPKWLDGSKLAELGFDTARKRVPGGREHDAIPAKEVFLVLELDGAAYQAALERARQDSQRAKAAQAGKAGARDPEGESKRAAERLRREESTSSRLFVIDAGLDAGALRARYPDRARHSIVRGQVRPYWDTQSDATGALVGQVVGPSVGKINVPLEFQPLLANAGERALRGEEDAQPPRREITVAFGRRLEPWITAVAKR